MQRRTVVAIAATVAAAGAAVAFTLPSMAGTNPTSDRTAARATTGEVAPQLLSAMKRDLGLSADEATAQVKRAKWASGVASGLRTQAARSYAGSWLTDNGQTLNIGITDADLADDVRNAGAVPKLVDRSVLQLDSAKRALDAAATKSDRADLPGWSVDVAANQVSLQALPGEADKAWALAREAGIPTDAVKVVTVKSAPRPLFDVIGAQPYFINIGGGQARCSIGFAVETGFVTAGHCGAEGAATVGFNREAQGEVAASIFPGEADEGFVQVNGDWTPQPFVDDFNGNALPVAGSTEAPIGAAICRSGSTTGTQCGRVLAKNETVNYPEGSVTGLTRTDACAEGGDSGGPWLVGDQAQGVTSGGSGDCTVGGETFFQPITEILERNNLTLVTQGGAGGGQDEQVPPADDAGAGDAGDQAGEQGQNNQDRRGFLEKILGY